MYVFDYAQKKINKSFEEPTLINARYVGSRVLRIRLVALDAMLEMKSHFDSRDIE